MSLLDILKEAKQRKDAKKAVEIMAEFLRGEKGDKGDTGEKGDKGDKGERGIKGIDAPPVDEKALEGRIYSSLIKIVKEYLSVEVARFKEFLTSFVVEEVSKTIKAQEEADPTLRSNLNIQELESKLDARDKSLWDRLKELVAKVAQQQNRISGTGLSRQDVLDLISGNAGGQFIREDLTSQCNGSNKVFTLSNAYVAGSVQLMGTQFPIIYRPSTDFTESGVQEVTLTAAVGAPETGQTLVAIYEKDVS